SYRLESVAEAAAQLQRNAVDDIHFVLIGAGDQFNALARRAKSLRNLTLTGWLAPGDVAQVLRFSHVGLMPLHSVKDTVPNKAFEYLAHGLPLLSSLRGEMEVLIDNSQIGLNYRSGDVRHLCQQAQRLAKSPELLKQLSANCSHFFREHFQPDRLYARFAEHIELTSRMRQGRSAGNPEVRISRPTKAQATWRSAC